MFLLQKAALGLLLLASTSLLQSLVFKRRKKSAAQRAHHDGLFPPGPPGSWPVLGHLPFLAAGCPHQVLAHLARHSLGPLIGLRLGSKHAVVVCNSDLAKEILHTHDKLLSNRPHFLFVDSVFYGYNVSIMFTSYNPRWALLRKLCALELFTTKRLQALQHLRNEEVHCLVESLLQHSCGGTQAVELGQFFSVMLCNTMSRMLHSKTLADVGGQGFSAVLKEQEREIAPTIGDFVPWLSFLDLPRKRAMKRLHDHSDKIIETMLSQRRQLMKSTPADELPQDFLQVLLSREANNYDQSVDEDELLTFKEIKGTIYDVLGAGTHTTSLALEWAIAELIRNPVCLQKLCNEIDTAMGQGTDQFVTDDDLPKLPYLEKVVKEVLRLHPSAPLFPRLTSEAVKVDKYLLPANTLVFVNVWAIGRDPAVWQNAEEFCPERFDGKDIDVKGQHYDLIPFGSGRRVCPGARLALSVLHVTLANLVKAFDWELPDGQSHMDMDMSEQRGITSMRATPLLAIPKLRLRA
ncbi:hypothetical protein GOP47_0016590 [Adiantum capillus-veneris]|uniref:Cytochrome P450 n=1 Tax=Adiantum capillus-veneris TaxID=13818 RepID=A0A9D4ZC81_ADICA|nr:hypothetical protein GOP47_0016590 [Adiantum capillus-veneris]